MPDKRCKYCYKLKPYSAFDKSSNARSKDGFYSRCKQCRPSHNGREKSRYTSMSKIELSRASHLMSTYKLTVEDYFYLLRKQDGKCAVCKTTTPGAGKKFFTVDHDHSCCSTSNTCGKCIRGLLCWSCNIGSGHLKDDPELMFQMQTYLLGNVNVLGEIR